ncbi:type II toxin-antitoxin system HigA family antitoxin [Chitinophaga sp. sic0106]|uniref:helix-turn-helix domain-containing protein n=1 Tax=Chitinophaga sp. sic0106 TaxID=2854785 RepID=UPI001C46C6FF|nr:hypothetical protein [Chitinophaga sp. sic0106]MBV7532722.1 hypothetical protein [Chitinophaga sp. sic0106]
MNFKLLKTEEDYNEAIYNLETIGDQEGFEENQDLITQFELLTKLIQIYEEEHAPITLGHPIEIILLKMEYMGLKQKDLVPQVGSSGVVSQVLNKKRGLSKNMIRTFSELLNIDQDILNTPYELDTMTHLKKKIVLRKKASVLNLFHFADTSHTKAFKDRVRTNGMLMSAC